MSPAYVHLKEIHPCLYIGGYQSLRQDDTWTDIVCCSFCHAATIRNASRVHALEFYDTTDSAVQTPSTAEHRIHFGIQCLAGLLSRASPASKILVNCHMGMNRSGAICTGYAVAYRGMTPAAAIAYVRDRNTTVRNLPAMTNHIFAQIIQDLEPNEFRTKPRTVLREKF